MRSRAEVINGHGGGWCHTHTRTSAAVRSRHRRLDQRHLGRGRRRRWASCLLAGLLSSWFLGVPTSAGASPATPSGNALLLSDLHFDPLADPHLVQSLLAAPPAQWQAIFSRSSQTAYAHFPNDTNYPLLNSTLSTAAAQKPFDFVIVSGDYLRHNFQSAFLRAGGSPDQFPAFAANTALFVINAVQMAFAVPVYFALGNDDSGCGDYRLTPDSAFLAVLADSIRVLARHPDATATFRTAGFYALSHPTVPNQEILILNSVLWSPMFSSCEPERTDAGNAELEWLREKLSQAKRLGHKVILVMHIPPGIDAYRSFHYHDGHRSSVVPFWREAYANSFITLMKDYGDVVEVALAGHTHMDDFRIVGTGSTAVAVRITPAVSPVFGNNPAFSALEYSVSTGTMSDIDTYWLNLSNGGAHPQWALEYRFSTAYGYEAFTPANLDALAARIHDDPSVRRIFAGYYAASAPSPLTSRAWRFYCCAENRLNPTDYKSCVFASPTTSRESTSQHTAAGVAARGGGLHPRRRIIIKNEN
ncbi:MAG: metallophosphoesterase [Verrucomicrobia bacterium]|nr:metallophosphoesterase [Verrucomicrobiota bacterium]